MRHIFSAFTQLTLRFRWITLAFMFLISVLGVIALTQLKQELVPSIEFPQTVILTQVSGMTSEQVLNVITRRLEDALRGVQPIENLESTTTGAFGSVIVARNNFGLDQNRVQKEVTQALNGIWLPLRRIEATTDTDPMEYARELLATLPAEVLIYLEEEEPNFLFQLSAETWQALSDNTVRSVLAYLSRQTVGEPNTQNALQQLVDQEIIPQLESLEVVARVSTSGGQSLPGESEVSNIALDVPLERSLLQKLAPDVWSVVAQKADLSQSLASAISDLAGIPVEIPTTPPALPENWIRPGFTDASDLLEMRTLSRTLAAAFNGFVRSGDIVGPLGKTDDLTPDIIRQMLAIEPSLANAFKAEHLTAMDSAVFAALPDDFVASLDGFTRDQLAASVLAEAITGTSVAQTPVDLPNAWRISPPQLISFSFDDLPLASFSVFGTETGQDDAVQSNSPSTPVRQLAVPPETESPNNVQPADLPEGPALPPVFGLIGLQFGIRLDTADDLINIQLPENLAAQLGSGTLSAADLLNFIVLLGDPNNLPPGSPQLPIAINPRLIIGSLSPEVVSYLIAHDPTFTTNLQPGVYDNFSDEVLLHTTIAPPLGEGWTTLAEQPEFRQRPLRTAADLLDLGQGDASTVLNRISEAVPDRFIGYEVRLFDGLTPGVLRYLVLRQPEFFASLSPSVLTMLSRDGLALIPQTVLEQLDPDVKAQIRSILAGEIESAADRLASQYQSDVPPADPTAPLLNTDWSIVAGFMNIELDTADDFSRFFPDTAGFINSLFDSAQGAAFAPKLLGNLPVDALTYMIKREPSLAENLRPEALQLLSSPALLTLPAEIQARAKTGAEPFRPSRTVTRTNGNSSLLVTVYKTSGSNTVEAFHKVADEMQRLDDANPAIGVELGFEQASFIEESISGVAREGGLGGIFAVVVILVFLSSGLWSRRSRRLTGFVIAAIFAAALGLLIASSLGTAGGDLKRAFDQADSVVRLLLVLGLMAGAGIVLWPGRIPRPAWRSTLVVAVSIPLSLLMAFAVMNWVPAFVHRVLMPLAQESSFFAFIIRLFPESVTINIMTLSGFTVAIGRVVDDSIVVLENIFRHIQEGDDRRQAIIDGTREVSVAIFSATVITVVVFLPLGLTGGIISEFFLPFGLAVTYSLLSSFLVAITVVPLLAYLFIGREEISGEQREGRLERIYLPPLRWSLASNRNRVTVLAIAGISLVIGALLFASRPTTFLPSLGEPQISVSVDLPANTKILETNAKVEELEGFVRNNNQDESLGRVQSIVGGGGVSLETLIGAGGSIAENRASITIGVEDQSKLDQLTQRVRQEAERIFGKENVRVSAATLTDQGFGGFELVLAGPESDLRAINQAVIDTLNSVPGITNATSDLIQVGAAGADGPQTYIRIDGQSAVSFSAELETDNTLGVTQQAIEKVRSLPDLPPTITVSQGFDSQLQTQGFRDLFVAMGIAIVMVIIILIITFGSVVHWFDIILSIAVAPVGAAVLLTLTDRVLGISAMIGLLMLIGIVVTNAVVLIDRVQANKRDRGMAVREALIEAGGRRLRPILMTALATVFALLPLAFGLSKGAIIAAELGTVVIGGLVSSTLLTLIVVPVMYSLLAPIHSRLAGLVRRRR